MRKRLTSFARDVAEFARRVARDRRYKWYRRGLWLASLLWAGIVAAQSIGYYTLIDKGKEEEELGHYLAAQALFEAALVEVQESLVYKWCHDRDKRYANVLNNLAESYRATAQFSLAEKYQRQLQDALQDGLGKNKEGYAIGLNNLATLNFDEGKYSSADALYRQALRCWEHDLHRPEDINAAFAMDGLAKTCRIEGHYPEAEALYSRSLTIHTRFFWHDDPWNAEIYEGLGALRCDEGKAKEAEGFFKSAFKEDERHYGLNHPYTAEDVQGLASAWRKQGRYGEAVKYYRLALSIRTALLGPTHPCVAKSWLGLGETYLATGDFRNAGEALQKAVSIDEKALGPGHPDTLISMVALDRCRRK